MLTTELVRRGARRHGNRTAVISGEQSLTFRDVDETANRMANALIGLGVERGTRVGLLVDNGLWSVPIDFACLKAGAVRVEDALMAHPAVAEAAVVGAPDPTWVEAVTAFVTLRPGAQASGAELQDAVRSALAGYKVPKSVHVVDQLPLSPVGKVLRRALREPLWADAGDRRS